MEIRVLRYFLALAKEGNMSRAASALHTTQPNLSRQLMNLESEIGCKLFNRGNKKITLTNEGLFFIKRAQEIVDLMDKTEKDMANFDSSTAGMVYIGAAEGAAARIFAKVINSIHNDHPKITYHLISGDYYNLLPSFDDELLDFCVMTDPADLKKYNYLKLPVKENYGILMKKDSPLAAKHAIRPCDLSDKRMIIPHQLYDTGVFSLWLGSDCKQLDVIVTYNLITTAAALVDENVGYAVVFENFVNTNGTDLCFKPLEPKFEAASYLVWRKYRPFTKAMKIFLEYTQRMILPPKIKSGSQPSSTSASG